MIDLIALIRGLVTLLQPRPRGKHRRNKSLTVHLSTPARAELWPAPEPIVMDGNDPRAYKLPRGPYAHLEQQRATRRSERNRRGLHMLEHISQAQRAVDDMSELRDLVRTAIAVGAVHS